MKVQWWFKDDKFIYSIFIFSVPNLAFSHSTINLDQWYPFRDAFQKRNLVKTGRLPKIGFLDFIFQLKRWMIWCNFAICIMSNIVIHFLYRQIHQLQLTELTLFLYQFFLNGGNAMVIYLKNPDFGGGSGNNFSSVVERGRG